MLRTLPAASMSMMSVMNSQPPIDQIKHSHFAVAMVSIEISTFCWPPYDNRISSVRVRRSQCMPSLRTFACVRDNHLTHSPTATLQTPTNQQHTHHKNQHINCTGGTDERANNLHIALAARPEIPPPPRIFFCFGFLSSSVCGNLKHARVDAR